jgi:uncharacterized membrane protein YraQ (UPF0718 family)
MTIWTIPGILAIISLIAAFWIKRNAIWSGLIIGVIIAVITAVIYKRDAINSAASKKIIVVCVLVGVTFELLGRPTTRKTPVR